MWWHLLIPGGCMVVTLSLGPAVCIPTWRKWYYGNLYNKDTDDCWIEYFWFRDLHLTGNPYKPNGISTLSDEPPADYIPKKVYRE